MKPEFREYVSQLIKEQGEICDELQKIFTVSDLKIVDEISVELVRSANINNHNNRNLACELMARQSEIEDTILAIFEERPIIDYAKAFEGYFERIRECEEQQDRMNREFDEMRAQLPDVEEKNENNLIQWVG